MAKKLWGGRFKKKTNPLVEEFTKSIQYDRKLAEYDLTGSLLHAGILKKSGLLKPQEAHKLISGLKLLKEKVKNKTFKPNYKDEDIHTAIQNALQRITGGAALKLHTARSRNEQVVFSTKLYAKAALGDLGNDIDGLSSALNGIGKKYKEVIIPGFTHMQHAQPVYLQDYLGAYVEMLKRDKERLAYIAKNIRLTLGAGALAGVPIDAKEYIGSGIKTTSNSLDTVSDRDFVIEIISALSILAMHLSRLSEDFIIWSTREFGFIDIDDAFCTGSSLMPQKKNPDVLELIRGYTGRLYGNLVSVLTMMKALPLAYNRDMQLDKEPLFNSVEIVSSELKVLSGLIKTLRFNRPNIEKHLEDESLYATDLVYYLANKKLPFKEAHTIIGRLIRYSLDNSISIKDIPEVVLKRFSRELVKDEIVELFDPAVSVKSRKSVRRDK